MTCRTASSRGADLERRLQEGCREVDTALAPGSRDLAKLSGVTQTCVFTRPQENVLQDLGQILVDSGRIYRYGNQIVLEQGCGEELCLTPLLTDNRVERSTGALLANIVICESPPFDRKSSPQQFFAPRQLIDAVLHAEPIVARLPRIRQYSRLPFFDENLVFRSPGWHPEPGILVHGPAIDPQPPGMSQEGEMIDRLPTHLRWLLMDFPFRTSSDLVNALGALLTGLLRQRYQSTGKPVVLADGNQPNLGKSWFMETLGVLFDGNRPSAVHYTRDDDELGKRICAMLRKGPASMVLVDNAKVQRGQQIDSMFLESMAVAPKFSGRILGESTTYEQPNDLLWALTMNGTKASSDLLSRALCIRFWYEGDPKTRDFCGRNPLEYAENHRTEILGELAGMVTRWVQNGRPLGQANHRLTKWASEIDGILRTNALDGFLENAVEVAGECNTSVDDLASLAEAAITSGDPMISATGGLPAGKLELLFHQAHVLFDSEGDSRTRGQGSQKARSTKIGTFLAPHVGSTVDVEHNGRSGQATLRCETGRSNRKLYRFEVVWTSPETDGGDGPDTTARMFVAAEGGELETELVTTSSEVGGLAVGGGSGVEGTAAYEGVGNYEQW